MKDTETPLEKFLRIRSYEVSETGCHVWKRSRNWTGYGTFHYHGKNYLAHRYAWQSMNGPIPPGLVVMHKCDNPPCINPEHRMLGTQADNSRDMVSKGRSSRGFGVKRRVQGASVTEQYALRGRTYTGDAAHKMRMRTYAREYHRQRYQSEPEARTKKVEYNRRWRSENREYSRAYQRQWSRARAQRQLEADPQAQARRYARLQQQRERALKREQHQQLMASTFGIQEIADLAGVDRTTVFRWFTSGKLRTVVDGHWRATADAVFPFLAERQKRKGWNKRNIA